MDLEQRVERQELFAVEVRTRLAVIEEQVRNMLANMSTKEDIANLRAEIARMESRMLRWFIGTAIALTTLAFAAAKLIH